MQIIQRRLSIPPTKHKKFIAHQVARVSCPRRRPTVGSGRLQRLRLRPHCIGTLLSLTRSKLQGKVLLMHCVYCVGRFLESLRVWECFFVEVFNVASPLTKKNDEEEENSSFLFLLQYYRVTTYHFCGCGQHLHTVFSVCVVVAQNRFLHYCVQTILLLRPGAWT